MKKNSRSYSDKSPIFPFPVPLHPIRSARRRDSAARGTGRVTLAVGRRGERGEKRGESNGSPDGKGEYTQSVPPDGKGTQNLTMIFI